LQYNLKNQLIVVTKQSCPEIGGMKNTTETHNYQSGKWLFDTYSPEKLIIPLYSINNRQQ